MLNCNDIGRTQQVLGAMIQYELALAGFYRLCADQRPEDHAFWDGLAATEMKHAENMEKMKEILGGGKASFEAGRPFNLTAVNTAISWLRENAALLAAENTPYERLLITARDLENSILESRYAEIIKTGDLEYQSLLNHILDQTRDHKRVIQEKIEGAKKG